MRANTGTRSAAHAVMVGTLVLCGIGAVWCGNAAQAADVPAGKAAAPAKTGVSAAAGKADRALRAAQDRAVANYRRNRERKAAAARTAQARAAAARAAAEVQARRDARALARAQDRVVAYYKGIPFETATRRVEILTCFSGIQDRHARIGVRLVNGLVNHFSFYSKAKPRTCSIDAGRDGAFSQWEDVGAASKVTLAEEKGVLLINPRGRGYHFLFRGIDRMRYCGMDGIINGSLTVTRGKSQCEVEGLMDGHQG